MGEGQAAPLDTSRLGQARAIQFQRDVAERLGIIEQQVKELSSLPEKVIEFDSILSQLKNKSNDIDALIARIEKFEAVIAQFEKFDKLYKRVEKIEQLFNKKDNLELLFNNKIEGIETKIDNLKLKMVDPDRVAQLSKKINDLENSIPTTNKH